MLHCKDRTLRLKGNLMYFPLLACNSSYANLTQDAPTAFLLWPAHYICGFSFRSFVPVWSAVTRFCGCLILAKAMCPFYTYFFSFSLSLSVQHAKSRWSDLSSVSGFYILFVFSVWICMLCFPPLNDGIILSFQERERRRQHVMLMKAVEARKKAEVCKTK